MCWDYIIIDQRWDFRSWAYPRCPCPLSSDANWETCQSFQSAAALRCARHESLSWLTPIMWVYCRYIEPVIAGYCWLYFFLNQSPKFGGTLQIHGISPPTIGMAKPSPFLHHKKREVFHPGIPGSGDPWYPAYLRTQAEELWMKLK